eukprot:1143209-Pelagomonas_calceolata.AAC.7
MEQRGPCPGIWGTPLKPCLCQRCLCTLVVAVVRKTPDQCVPGHPARACGWVHERISLTLVA